MAFAKSYSWKDLRSDDIAVALSTLLRIPHQAESQQTMVSDFQLRMQKSEMKTSPFRDRSVFYMYP